MLKLTDTQCRYILELLERGETLPLDYKYLLFPLERQEYELVYAGKEREEDVLAETMGVPLQPIRTFGDNGSNWHNMLIFGDNLQAMKTLLKMKEQGKLVNADGTKGVRLIYIDPPFATRQEFKGGQDEKAYQDKIIGSQFIEFLRKRLILMRELLAPNGSIYIHLDYRKGHYMKIIMDEVFQEHNFVNEIIWQRTASHNDPKRYGCVHDTLLLYRKTSDFIWKPPLVSQNKKYIDSFFVYAESPKGEIVRLKKGEEPPPGWRRFRLGNFASPRPSPNLIYEYKGYNPPKNGWKVTKEKMEELDREGRLYFPPDKNGRIQTKSYLDEVIKGKVANDVWTDIPPVQAQSAEKQYYPTQKPERLIKRIIEASSNPGDLILDAFVGSGTTLAVAEKLGRRWIGIDCGKLAIYTIQKRMFNLKNEIGNKGKSLKPKPFTLYNAGLYDFSRLKEMPWDGWRSYALVLFQCQDKPHIVAGIELDGYRGGDDVLVFNHMLKGGVILDYGFIDDLHAQIGAKIGARFFIIAPAASVAFLEDYVDKGRTRYYILRIPYSIINELHNRNFEALTQPGDETQVNETVEAFGFDFIRQPKVECDYFTYQREGEAIKEAIIKIKTFKSEAMAKGVSRKDNLETLSMVLVDYDYPYDLMRKGKESPPPFELDKVYFANDIQAADWEVRIPFDLLGEYLMLIYIDIYGNEYTEVKRLADFGNNKSKRK